MKTYRVLLISIVSTFFMTSCAKISSVSTNLDQENFTQYFSPGEVEIYQDESEFKVRSKMLGMVEGQACQIKAHHALPDSIDARTEARRNAYQLGANAIVFSGCADIETSQVCHAAMVCYGKAYYLEQTED